MKLNSLNQTNFTSIKLTGDFKKSPYISSAFQETKLYQTLNSSKDSYSASLKTKYVAFPSSAEHKIDIKKIKFGFIPTKTLETISLKGHWAEGVTKQFIRILKKY